MMTLDLRCRMPYRFHSEIIFLDAILLKSPKPKQWSVIQ